MGTNIQTLVEQAKNVYDLYSVATDTNELTVEARALQAGDRLAGVNPGLGGRVESTRAGNSKVIVKFEGRKTEVRFDFDETVVVAREVPIAESVEAKEALHDEYKALRHLAQHAGGTEDAEAKIAEYVAQGWWERVAEHAADLAASIPVRGDYLGAVKAVESGGYTGMQAIKELRASWTTALVNNYDSPTWSGGFTVKNAVLQDTAAARRKALQQIEWIL